jgi:hypothetical protein
MHHEPGRLVHNEQVLVLEDHRHGYLLRQGTFIGHPRFDPLTATHLVRGRAHLTIHQQRSITYYALNCATAHIQAAGDEPVEAFPGLRGVHLEAVEDHSGYYWGERGRIFCKVAASAPRTRTTLSRLEEPRITATSERETSSDCARKRSTSALALPQTGGAATLIFSAAP